MTPWLLLFVVTNPAYGYQVEIADGYELNYLPGEEWHPTGPMRAVAACGARGVLKGPEVKTWFCWLTPCGPGPGCEQRCWTTRADCEGDRWEPWAATTELVQQPWRWPTERTRIASHPTAPDGIAGSGSYNRGTSVGSVRSLQMSVGKP